MYTSFSLSTGMISENGLSTTWFFTFHIFHFICIHFFCFVTVLVQVVAIVVLSS